MFNMLVGLPDGGLLSKDRLLEATPTYIRDCLNVDHGNFAELLKLPTLAMPEVGPKGSRDEARVGSLSRITPSHEGYLLKFIPDAEIAPIPVNEILANSKNFGVEQEWDLHRTRLMVKDIDLYRTVLRLRQSREVIRPSRMYLNFPDGPIDENLVVVMMPFEEKFDPVWKTIQRTVYNAGLRCERADSIWDQDSIMNDIVGLLWRARIVITDYTGHNANVFYETGIAHTLGRQCIPLTQSIEEIPFDLRQYRALEYKTTDAELKKLGLDLGDRIQGIVGGN